MSPLTSEIGPDLGRIIAGKNAAQSSPSLPLQVLCRAPVAQRAVRSVMVVIRPPSFDLALRILDRQELVRVQTFIAQLAVEGFDKAVFDRLSASDEVEQDTRLLEDFDCDFSPALD